MPVNATNTTTVLLCGVGGQGTILAADLLAKTAIAAGCTVKLSEIHGMSQRGGAVTTIVRFGDDVSSMVTDPGSADYIIDMGPGGGSAGGKIVACGTPDEIAASPESITGRFLERR